MDKSFWTGFGVATLICFVILGAIFVFQFRTGKVVAEISKPQLVGEYYEADLFITIEEGDSLPGDSQILVMIEKDGVVIKSQKVSLEEYIALSDNPVQPAMSEGIKYYQTPGTYTVKLTKILQWRFSEVGDYEVNLLILDENVKFDD